MLYTAVVTFFQALFLFLSATVVFDLIHYLLHRCLQSKNALLRQLGVAHLHHHRFYTADLKINEKYTRSNLIFHVVAENATQLLIILSGLAVLPVTPVLLAAAMQMLIFSFVMIKRGIDLNHQSLTSVPAYRGGWYVTAPYHALHHHHMSCYFSSYIKIIDFIFGTGHYLAKKNIVMTGASGALGSQMKKLLEAENATVTTFKYGKDYEYGNYDQLIPALQKADILFLCHGSKFENAQQANCDSYVDLIHLYQKVHEPGLLPPEVWATGSEIECHPCFGIKKIQVYAASKRQYAKHARAFYRDESIQYRHLVHAAFMSTMGPGLMTASFAARATLFLLKRGCRYVPVTYTGFGLLNYFRFLFNI